MVFYRKYRPQRIHDLDSTAVRETLIAILKQDSAHAFLFTGPKGLGKTSTARIVAKAVNCLNRKKGEVEPCNACEPCNSISSGTNMDILEIDAASNRGIDEIRELKERISLAPLKARKKVYIIDEVHMLTTEAFNALLKTLEEPPAHSLFILCTTEPQKVPATILSRCFHIAFSPATNEELVRSFQRIVKGEGLQVEAGVLEMIAELADRGFRDGTRIMEELAAIATDKVISKALVEERYKTTSIQKAVEELEAYLEKRDQKKALQLVTTLSNNGVYMQQFITNVTTHFHTLLLTKAGVLPGSKKESAYTIPELQLLLGLLGKATIEMKNTVVPQLPLELVILTWCAEGDEVQEKESLEKKVEGDETPKKVIEETQVTVTTLRKEVGNIAKIKALYGEEKPIGKSKDDSMPSDVSILNFTAEGEITPQWLAAFWKSLIAEMKAHNHTLAGVLRGCTIKSFDRKLLTIETAYKFHKERLDQTKTLEALQEVCKALTGKAVAVNIVLRSN